MANASRIFGKLFAALLLGLSLSAFGATSPLSRITGTITTENLVDAGACTAGGCVEVDVATAGALTIQVTGTYTAAGGLSGQVTTDGTNWITLGATSTLTRQSTGVAAATITSGQQDVYQVSAITGARRFRVTALGAVTGTATITIQRIELSIGGAGGGGTSSTFGAAVPSAGTAAGLSDGTNMVLPRAFDADSGAGTQTVAGVSLRKTASGGSVEAGTSTDPLRTDPTGTTTQPVSGTVSITANSAVNVAQMNGVATTMGNGASGTGVQRVTIASDSTGQVAALVKDGAGNAITSAARGAERAVSVQIVDASGAQVTTFGGSGGTASNFGSAVPATGTAAGVSDGTNMVAPRSFDADTGAGTQNVLGVNVRLGASGGGIELVGGAGTAAAGVLRTVEATDSQMSAGVGATGDAAATAGSTGSASAKLRLMTTQLATLDTSLGTINTSINANPTAATPIAPATATATTGLLTGAQYNSTPPTFTNGQQGAYQIDAAGRQLVNIQTNAATNTAQINGVTVLMGNGVSGTGAQRVTLASDSTGQVALAAGSATIGALTANQSVNVAQINGVTTLMGAGNTGTGSQRVTIATDQAAHATHGHGATGSAVPANATMVGGRSGANLAAIPVSDTTAAINMSTATTTQIVALSGSTKILVGSLSVLAGGTTNVTLVYGTGTNCATGQAALTGPYPLTAQVGLVLGGGPGGAIVVPASQALCVTSSAAVQVSGHVTYTQYVP